MDATFGKSGPGYELQLVRRLRHAPERVWRVLTERELLKQWFPADIAGEWKVGAPLRFTFLHGEGEGLPDEAMRGEVLALDPPRLLEFRWGTEVIRCELIPRGDGSKLVFSTIFDDASCGARSAAGWEMCLANLEALAEGGTPAKFSWDVWRKKFSHYVQRLEPEYGPQQGAPENIHR